MFPSERAQLRDVALPNKALPESSLSAGLARFPQANLPWLSITQLEDEETGKSQRYSHLQEMERSTFPCPLPSPAARCWAGDEWGTQTLNTKAALRWAEMPPA